jgi:hypothetical protein
MAKALNVETKKKDKFETVDFVHNKTPYQLKIFIRDLWQNLQEVATALEEVRPDITQMIDNMLDGEKINPNHLRDRLQYFQVGQAIVEHDSLNNSITVLNDEGEMVCEDIKGYDLKIIQATLKKKLIDAKNS